uniref:Lipocalin n=1 Tax=Rhipicephalus appendiculatus TaxID=34631 RepID=A0A131YZU0_RHIAP
MRHGVIVAIFFVIVAHTKLTEWLFPGIHVFSHRMRDFVNTREFIWVYKTSTTSPVHCKFDSMRFIQPLFIVFNRTVLYNGVRTSVALRGHFSTRNTNRMYTMHAANQAQMLHYLTDMPKLSLKAIKLHCLLLS